MVKVTIVMVKVAVAMIVAVFALYNTVSFPNSLVRICGIVTSILLVLMSLYAVRQDLMRK